ncbi:hypothetical protein A7R81_09145 [Pseudomonas aeruginosa]|nr:hypothetical protein A7R81_09145 [Pseudomonas aeruginosa]
MFSFFEKPFQILSSLFRDFIRDINVDLKSQLPHDLEKLPPMNRLAATLHFAEEVLGDADAARGVVLAHVHGLAA